MPCSSSTKNTKPCDYIRKILKFFLDPIAFWVEQSVYYTNISPFYYSNYGFWHTFILALFLWFPVFPLKENNKPDPVKMSITMVSVPIAFIASIMSVLFASESMPKIQKMTHIIWGLFGMILSIWTMIGCGVALYLDFHWEITFCIYCLSIVTLFSSYFLFWSVFTNLYIRLPVENQPFTGIKLNVILFGLLHLMVFFAIIQIANIWPMLVVFLSSSFFFCIDAYACFFTNSYELCEHREEKFDMKDKDPIDGIICHVAVRSHYENKVKKDDLPDGFQFDDDLEFEDKWYRKMDSKHVSANQCTSNQLQMATYPVWTVFSETDSLSKRAKCKLCENWYSYNNGANGLICHLRNFHDILIDDLKEDQKSNHFVRSSGNGTDFIHSIRSQQARMIAACNLSFSIVENIEFRKYVTMLRDNAPLITSDTARSDLLSLEKTYRNDIRIAFKNRRNLVLLSDGWSSSKVGYQLYCLVAAFLTTDGKMKQKLVGVIDVPNATTIEIHKMFINELKRSGLSMSQFSFMVSDGGTNLQSLAEHVDIPRIHCGAHILHLVVSEIIKDSEISKILGKAKKIATKLSKSHELERKTREKSLELKNLTALPQSYSPTRWNGSRDLLLAVKRHIGTLSSLPEFAEDLFSMRESLLMDFFVDLTAPFQEASTRFESTSCCASEVIPHFVLLRKNVTEVYSKYAAKDEIKDSSICALMNSISLKAERLLSEQISKMKTSEVLKISAFLDHRFSRSKVLDDYEWDQIESEVLSKFEDTLSEEKVDEGRFEPLSSTTKISSISSLLFKVNTSPYEVSEKKTVKNELNLYRRSLEQCQTTSFSDDPIGFWKQRKAHWPLVSSLALRYLAIPASSANTERIFSSAGRIVANRLRNRMTLETCTSFLMVNAMAGFERLNDTLSDYGVILEDEESASNQSDKIQEIALIDF